MTNDTYTVPDWFTDYLTGEHDPREVSENDKDAADKFISTLPDNYKIFEYGASYMSPYNDLTGNVPERVVRIKIKQIL